MVCLSESILPQKETRTDRPTIYRQADGRQTLSKQERKNERKEEYVPSTYLHYNLPSLHPFSVSAFKVLQRGIVHSGFHATHSDCVSALDFSLPSLHSCRGPREKNGFLYLRPSLPSCRTPRQRKERSSRKKCLPCMHPSIHLSIRSRPALTVSESIIRTPMHRPIHASMRTHTHPPDEGS